MEWSEVIDNPMLANLPFKIELTRFGQLLMSPASNEHGRIQSRLSAKFLRKPGGEVITECSIQTTNGIKVADVAWLSEAFVSKYGFTTPYPKAPELCVEIISPSNSMEEMREKIQLYLEAGAIEVWLVRGLDDIQIFNAAGEAGYSQYFSV
ncbi:Uma2 family endonuclease [Ectothiorhodospiraceae bacterium BW-2]|nr:Uma2 family endonuclease [Ectothiorhodospiraceae bacterium BW-2]